jgi:hypothetical protein
MFWKAGLFMFKLTARLAVALTLTVAAIGGIRGHVAHAQNPGAPAGAQADPLGLSPDQQKKMAEIEKSVRADMQKVMAKYKPKMDAVQKKYQSQAEAIQKLPPAEQAPKGLALRKKFMAEPEVKAVQEELMKLQGAAEKKILAILKPAQQTKFKAMMAQQKAMAKQQMGG